jgi:hypothetical protein
MYTVQEDAAILFLVSLRLQANAVTITNFFSNRCCVLSLQPSSPHVLRTKPLEMQASESLLRIMFFNQKTQFPWSLPTVLHKIITWNWINTALTDTQASELCWSRTTYIHENDIPRRWLGMSSPFYLSTSTQCKAFTVIIIIIIIIKLNCKWVCTRWQWYYNKTQHTKIYIVSQKKTHHAQIEHSTQSYTNNKGHNEYNTKKVKLSLQQTKE